MTRKTLKFVASYLIFLAVPLLVFVSVLRSGRTLVAPVSIGGLWRIQANAGNALVLPGGDLLSPEDASFMISQSGKTFTLNFSHSICSTSGTVKGTIIRATLLPVTNWAGEARCDLGRALTLTATVDSTANARVLAGIISVEECPTCTVIHFRAVREK